MSLRATADVRGAVALNFRLYTQSAAAHTAARRAAADQPSSVARPSAFANAFLFGNARSRPKDGSHWHRRR